MTNLVEYVQGAELPDPGVSWFDAQGALIDFSANWTFTVKVGLTGSAAALTKTTGITGAATAPNLLVSWTTSELDGLPVGLYVMQVFARHTLTNKDRAMQILLRVRESVG